MDIEALLTQEPSYLLEKQQAFDRSKIQVSHFHRHHQFPADAVQQERIVHPCGSSAFGSFEVTADISHLTKADFLQPGKKTPAYTRFSTVTYGREFPGKVHLGPQRATS